MLTGDSSAADQLLRARRALGIADLLERSRLRPKDDDAYYPSQPIPESEDMDAYCETVSTVLKDADGPLGCTSIEWPPLLCRRRPACCPQMRERRLCYQSRKMPTRGRIPVSAQASRLARACSTSNLRCRVLNGR